MNSTNNLKKEKELLHKLALDIIEASKKEVSTDKNSNNVDSYYKQTSLASVLKPYAFDTIVDLRAELYELWKDNANLQKFIPVVLAATFKSRPESSDEGAARIEHKDEKNSGILPVYTYTL